MRQLLRKHHYRRRQAQKKITMREVPLRNAQFEKIQRLRADYAATGDPILSMDSKKKEHLGNFYRAGKLYTLEELRTYDHDFTSLDEGVIIPHSLYDVGLNVGYIQLGTSHDTSELAIESLRRWWHNHGLNSIPTAGGSCSCVMAAAVTTRGTISSSTTSKNSPTNWASRFASHTIRPIRPNTTRSRHCLFPHVTRACQGAIFTSVALVQQLMAKTHTQTGLHVFVQNLDQVYETGRKVAADFKKTMRIVFDEILPQWNYRAIPLSANGQVI